MIRTVISILSITFSSLSTAQIHLNEIVASNSTGIVDSDGDHEDWIEIYNSSSISISLGGWYLSDRDNNLRMWKFPDTLTIKSKEYVLIWASGKDRKDHQELHTNFNISRNGEAIILSNSDGNIIDRFPPIELTTDRSYGRSPDGSNNLTIFHTPTPGSSNVINGKPPIVIQLAFSKKDGYHPKDFLLEILASAQTEIRYTLDGSDPDNSAMVYSSPIKVTSLKGIPNVYADIQSGRKGYWYPPAGEVPKIRIVRAKAYQNGMPASDEIWGSFWTGHHDPVKMKIPIVSLITNPPNFFDYHDGIYVPGIDWDTTGVENSWRRGRETEKLAFFTYFDSLGDKQLHQQIGVRINGFGSRKIGQKSLRLYARSEYGTNVFDYPFFPERNHQQYRRLLLNTTMGDYAHTLFKDELTTNLTKPLGFEYLAFRPVLVFVNGEYWALHFLKERRDHHYLSALSGHPEDKIQMLFKDAEVDYGHAEHYKEMLYLIKHSDPEKFGLLEEIGAYMDIENYIDYQISEIYLANQDWPHNNIHFWRPNMPGGKWRWIFYDLDVSMRMYNLDNLTEYNRPFNPDTDKHEWATDLLRSLLRIPEFNRAFKSRFYQLMQTTLSTENILHELGKIRSEIEPYVADYIYRWRIPRSVTEWESNITILETFAMLRPAEMRALLHENMGSPFKIYPNPGEEAMHIQYTIDSEEIPRIQMFDILGKEINIQQRIRNFNSDIEVDMHGVSPGVYLIYFTYKGMRFTHKWVKNN